MIAGLALLLAAAPPAAPPPARAIAEVRVRIVRGEAIDFKALRERAPRKPSAPPRVLVEFE